MRRQAGLLEKTAAMGSPQVGQTPIFPYKQFLLAARIKSFELVM